MPAKKYRRPKEVYIYNYTYQPTPPNSVGSLVNTKTQFDKNQVLPLLETVEAAISTETINVAQSPYQWQSFDEGRVRVFGLPGKITFSRTTTEYKLTVDKPSSILAAQMVLDSQEIQSSAQFSSNLSLSIEDLSKSRNTWQSGSQTLDETDLWIPTLHVMDIGGTKIGQDKATGVSHNVTSTVKLDPDFSWGSGIGSYTFLILGNLANRSRLFVQLNFAG